MLHSTTTTTHTMHRTSFGAENSMEKGMDRHHLLFPRAEWSLRPNALKLRGSSSLIMPIEKTSHMELHRVCPPVPALGHYALERTVRLYEPQNDYIDSLENLMSSIEASADAPKAHDNEKELALLTVDALDYQRRFIRGLR